MNFPKHDSTEQYQHIYSKICFAGKLQEDFLS